MTRTAALSPARCILTDEPLRVDPLIEAVSGPGQTCIVVVIGTVRDLRHARRITGVQYQTYSPTAPSVLHSLIDRCEQTADGVRVALAHRTGVVHVGEATHIIVASARHDTHAHTAARTCTELLKNHAPIWRKETYTDGTEWTAIRP
ncbi:molybdenum cofactor biosynthesis protein MoaE [Streptomyces sp. NPDC126514]|uniref:molybdenum cofactor biosynthesis protein MoaE n=1 Tax=Streptomyces sp. NPDC126514 TaxID=3155210 RepID=UPI0033246065